MSLQPDHCVFIMHILDSNHPIFLRIHTIRFHRILAHYNTVYRTSHLFYHIWFYLALFILTVIVVDKLSLINDEMSLTTNCYQRISIRTSNTLDHLCIDFCYQNISQIHLIYAHRLIHPSNNMSVLVYEVHIYKVIPLGFEFLNLIVAFEIVPYSDIIFSQNHQLFGILTKLDHLNIIDTVELDVPHMIVVLSI